MSTCAIKSRMKVSEQEPSILLEHLNRVFPSYKKEDGGNTLYDYATSKHFMDLHWGGDYTYKEPGDPGYDEYIRVQKLYENSPQSYNRLGEPKLFSDGTRHYLLNYKGEKIILNNFEITEQQRLDVINGITLALINKIPFARTVMESVEASSKKATKEFISVVLNSANERLAYLEQEIDRVEMEYLEDPDNAELYEQDIDSLRGEYKFLNTRAYALNAILESPEILRSVETEVYNTLRNTGEPIYSQEKVVEDEGARDEMESAMDDIKNHMIESSEVRDTVNIGQDIFKLLSSVVDFEIIGGKPVDKSSLLLGLDFKLGIPANVVKNRVMENVANIVEYMKLDGEVERIQSPYDEMISRLETRASELGDEILTRFLKSLNNHYATIKTEQDQLAFQVQFFKAFSKGSNTFILTEVSQRNNKLKLSYVDPTNVQSKSNVIGTELFNIASLMVNQQATKDPNRYNSQAYSERLYKMEKRALANREGIDELFSYHGIKLSDGALTFLDKYRDNLSKPLNLNAPGVYTLESLIKDIFDKEHTYVRDKEVTPTETKVDGKTVKVFRSRHPLIETVAVGSNTNGKQVPTKGRVTRRVKAVKALQAYHEINDATEKMLIVDRMTSDRFEGPFHILGKVEAIFRPDIADSNFNIAGKSRWKYSLMAGINKEILKWKAEVKTGTPKRLLQIKDRGIPYVEFLLAEGPRSERDIKDRMDNLNESLEQAKNFVMRQRIERLELVTFSQMRDSSKDSIIEHKKIGESDMHIDAMFKMLKGFDDIYNTLDDYNEKREVLRNYNEKLGKSILPMDFNADGGAAYGIKGLMGTNDTDFSDNALPGVVVKHGEIIDINARAKEVFSNMMKGEMNEVLNHNAFIREYLKLFSDNSISAQKKAEHVVLNLIPNVHYLTKHTVTELSPDYTTDADGNITFGNKTVSEHKYNKETGITTVNTVTTYSENGKVKTSETKTTYEGLTAELIENAYYNNLGFFNSVWEKARADERFDSLFEPSSDSVGNRPVMLLRDTAPMFLNYNEADKEGSSASMFNVAEKYLFPEIIELAQDNLKYLTELSKRNNGGIAETETNIIGSNTPNGVGRYILTGLMNNMSLFYMFNGDLMYFKQKGQTLSMEDALKRSPAPNKDGLQYHIREKGYKLNNEQFNSASENRKDNFLDYTGNQVEINRETHCVVAVVDDMINSNSKYARQITDGLGKENQALINYENEIADAGAYTTLGFYKRTMLQVQAWTKHDEEMFQELSDPNVVLTDKHYKWLKQSGKSLQPLKLVGYDLITRKATNEALSPEVEMPVFLKFAPVILVPGIIKNTDVEHLYNKMNNDGVDMIVCKSGSKVSNLTTTTIHKGTKVSRPKLSEDQKKEAIDNYILNNPDVDASGLSTLQLREIYDNHAELLEEYDEESFEVFDGLKSAEEMKLNPFPFSLSHLKWQVELPTHFFDETTLGTQHVKNLVANMDINNPAKVYEYKGEMIDAKTMIEKYNEAMINILMAQYERFKTDYGIDFSDNGINYKSPKLREMLIKQLDSATDFHLITLLRDSEVPLETIPGIAQRLFPVLSSLIKKDVGKIKTNGGAVIQVANIGFDRLSTKNQNDTLFLTNDTELTPPKPITILDLKTNELENLEGISEDQMEELLEYRKAINSKDMKASKEIINRMKAKYGETYIYYSATEDGKPKASLNKTEGSSMKINKAKVLIPFADIQKELGMSWAEFKQMIGNNKAEWEKGNQEGLSFDERVIKNLISYRIPNQSISSNDSMEVVGILPPTAGDQAVVYHEITKKAGSDFDIDKLYVMTASYNVDKKTKKVYYSDKGLQGYQNDLLEAMISVLGSEATYDDLMSPLDSDIIKDGINKTSYFYYLQDFYRNNSKDDNPAMTYDEFLATKKFSPMKQLTPVYKTKNRVDMLQAKQLVATMANHMSDLSYSQLNKLSGSESLIFGNRSLNNIYVKGYEGDPEMKITKIVSYFMNAAVDAAKDNYIIEGNFNNYTANAAMYLARSGVHPDEIFKLLMHPTILRISQLKLADTELITDVSERLTEEGATADKAKEAIQTYLNYVNQNDLHNMEIDSFDEFLELIDDSPHKDTLLKGYWFYLLEMGKELNDDIANSKPETKAGGKDLYEHMAILNRYEKGLRGNIGTYDGNGQFRTLAKLFKGGLSKEDADNFTFEFKDLSDESNLAYKESLTPFGVIMNNSVMLTNLLAKNLFIEATDNYRFMVNRISEMTGNTLDTSADNLKSISKFMYPIVLSQANHELYNDTSENQSLMINTLFNRLSAFKNLGPLKDNKLLQMLWFDPKTRSINFPSVKTMDSADKNRIKEEFRRLYDAHTDPVYSKDPATKERLDQIRQFAKDLIKYNFLAYGFKPNKSAFYEFAPNSYFLDTNHAYAITKLIETLNDASFNSQELLNIIDASISMLVYMNPRNYRFAKVNKYVNDKFIKGLNKPLDTNNSKLLEYISTRNGVAPFVTIRNYKNGVDTVYKLVSRGGEHGISPIYAEMESIRESAEDKSFKYLQPSKFLGRHNISSDKLLYLSDNNKLDDVAVMTSPELIMTGIGTKTNYESNIDRYKESVFYEDKYQPNVNSTNKASNSKEGLVEIIRSYLMDNEIIKKGERIGPKTLDFINKQSDEDISNIREGIENGTMNPNILHQLILRCK